MIFIVIIGIAMLFVWAVRLIKPLQSMSFKAFKGSLSPEQREKYVELAIWCSAEELQKKDFLIRLRNIGLLLAAGLVIGSVLFFDTLDNNEINTIDRPEFGEGSSRAELAVNVDGKDIVFHVTANEREPDSNELKTFFDNAAAEAFAKALNGNATAEHITKDMDLIEKTSSGAEISWKISQLIYMSSYGKLRGKIPEEGEELTLTAKIAYGDYSQEYDMQIVLFPDTKPMSEEESLIAEISGQIVEEKERLVLPDGYDITTPRDEAYRYILILSGFAAIILWLLSSEELDKKYERRQSELIRDYPGIISELSILLASGLSVTEGWKRIGEEYERRIKNGDKRSAGYEELLLSVNSIKNTGQVDKTFNDFARRCSERHYRQLAALLLQSIRKGSMQVSLQLKKETEDAFNMRKDLARQAGERAQAKLMLPSFMLLILVLALVIYPAWKGM